MILYLESVLLTPGHVCWRLLRHEPRIKVGVPICSTPSENLRFRLIDSPLPPNTTESPVPKDVLAYFRAPCAPGAYNGKKILAVFGGLDNVMPRSLADDRWPVIASEAAAFDTWVDSEFGHVVSQDMVRHAAEWLWRWGLTE